MKAFIVGGNKELINFFSELEFTNKLEEAKIVIFDDGPVVSPSLYKEKKDSGVEYKCDINRDRSDKAIYTKLRSDQIAVGISRGACFLSVMNGAKLIQSVTRQPDISESSCFVNFKYNGETFALPVLSNWTQSVNLLGCKDYNVIAWSKSSIEYVTDAETKRFMKFNGDPELFEFRRPKQPICICIQFHPEWVPESYFSKIVKQHIYDYVNS